MGPLVLSSAAVVAAICLTSYWLPGKVTKTAINEAFTPDEEVLASRSQSLRRFRMNTRGEKQKAAGLLYETMKDC